MASAGLCFFGNMSAFPPTEGTCQGEAVEPEGEAEPQAHVPEEGANGEMEATWKGEGMHACYKRL